MVRKSVIPPRPGRPTVEFATLVVRYPAERGRVLLRGSTEPMDWDTSVEPVTVDGDVSIFQVPVPGGGTVEVKPIREDGRWAFGRNLILAARDAVEISPAFEHEAGRMHGWREVDVPDAAPVRMRYFLPPGYEEHQQSRYPTLYCLDGQALFSDGYDPYGNWDIDHALDELWALGVIEELVVVAIDTSHDRLDRLGPEPDPHHGGGHAAEFLATVADRIVPLVDRELRTRAEPSERAILGASMGGLFSLFAAWRRPDVFGAAICFSSSFWWADRWMIQEVRSTPCPVPRPTLYLDSGATASTFAEDANLRDGQHHTRAMLRALVEHGYLPGDDLHVLAFPGQPHAAGAWAARIAVPLQLIFPTVG
ncbi:MAG: alpha/beta hydrolase [Sandaracinaceae bacterium]|nr:alpha/beta hydrolase [Sandaracinaceae bacterium]